MHPHCGEALVNPLYLTGGIIAVLLLLYLFAALLMPEKF